MKNIKPIFGVAGFPLNFKKSDYRKKRENIFEWLKKIGLDWIELQSTYGIKMKEEQAILYKKLAKENNIGLSIHAPYYISLGSEDKDIIKRSQQRVIESFELASWLECGRVIFHPGYSPLGREEGVKRIISRLNDIKNDLPIDKINIYPEIGGKKKQIGSLDDIMMICEQVSYAKPCIDLAHLHAREERGLINTQDFIEVFNTIESRLGKQALNSIHIHMYPVEVDKNGERTHKAFTDIQNETNNEYFYPRAEQFVSAIIEKQINPIVVCEAKDTQDEGALFMKSIYSRNKNNKSKNNM